MQDADVGRIANGGTTCSLPRGLAWPPASCAAAFVRKKEILPLRYLLRHRGDLVAQAGQQVQLMQKVLTEMNLHIHHVFSDVDGVSAQAIITAILAGEHNAAKLAPCATAAAAPRWKKSKPRSSGTIAPNTFSSSSNARPAGSNSTNPSPNATPRSRYAPPPSPA